MTWYKRDIGIITINLYVQPGAKHTEIIGLHGNSLKIKLNAPPIEGRANEALLKYIAQIFEVPTRQVMLRRGDKSRNKTVVISGSSIDPEQLTG